MKPTLQILTSLVPPPAAPFEAEGDWNAVEQNLGQGIPQEYKEFIGAYGTGEFWNKHGVIVFPFNPFASRKDHNFLFHNRDQDRQSTADQLRDESERGYFGNVVPQWFENFLDPKNFVRWSQTDFAVEFFWRTQGNPENWSVAAVHFRDNKYEEFQGETMLSFLEGIFFGRLTCSIFPDWYSAEGIYFKPRRPPRMKNT